jgi:hypothetical protein
MFRGLFSEDSEEDDNISVHASFGSTQDIEREGLVYLAGYVASRYRQKYPWLMGEPSEVVGSEWISKISRGGLVYPSDEFMHIISIENEKFFSFHGEWIFRGRKAFTLLTELIYESVDTKWPKEVVTCFIRTRTYVRVKFINKKLKDGVNGSLLKKKLKKLKT